MKLIKKGIITLFMVVAIMAIPMGISVLTDGDFGMVHTQAASKIKVKYKKGVLQCLETLRLSKVKGKVISNIKMRLIM